MQGNEKAPAREHGQYEYKTLVGWELEEYKKVVIIVFIGCVISLVLLLIIFLLSSPDNLGSMGRLACFNYSLAISLNNFIFSKYKKLIEKLTD